jgi:hypothetical protein
MHVHGNHIKIYDSSDYLPCFQPARDSAIVQLLLLDLGTLR